MKNLETITAIALTAAIATVGYIGINRNDFNPNTFKMDFQGETIGHFHCTNNEFQPLHFNNLGLDATRWYDQDELLYHAGRKVVKEHGILGGFGAAIFVDALFEKGGEICGTDQFREMDGGEPDLHLYRF